jgi:hypothetical protein
MRADFVSGHNQMLQIFALLQIMIAPAKSDFYDRRETEVLRWVARKP